MMLSLIPFHRFLIASAILFCAGFAAWAFVGFLGNRSIGTLLLSLVFAVLAVLLALYLGRLRQFLKLPDDRPPGGAGSSR